MVPGRMTRVGHHNVCSVYLVVASLLCSSLLAFGQMPAAEQRLTPQASGNIVDSSSGPRGERCNELLRQSETAIGKEAFSPAATLARRALQACPDGTRPLLLLARAQMLSHEFASAEQSLSRLLAKDPHYVAALILLGQVQYLDNHDSDAAASFQKAIAAEPDKPDPHYWLGRLHYQDGQIPQAIGEFQTALRVDAAYYKAYDGLGLCYEAMGENGHAADAYLKAIELVHKDHPDYDTAYADFAELLLKVGKAQQAFDLASEAAKRDPRAPRNFFLAGKALEQQDQDDAALRWLLKAAQMDPGYPEPHYLLARIYHKKGKVDVANREAAEFKELSARAPKIRR